MKLRGGQILARALLVAGFLLSSQGIENNELLLKLSDIGITLLLFIVGLKLNLRTLAKPQVWAVAGIHVAISSPFTRTVATTGR